jgi:hypothetical protein
MCIVFKTTRDLNVSFLIALQGNKLLG